MLATLIGQVSPSELAKIVEGVFETFRVELFVKDDAVYMGGHDHIGIDGQRFFLDAKIETVCDDFAGIFTYKNRQPIHDSESCEIKPDAFNDAIAFQCLPSFSLSAWAIIS